MPPPAQMTKNLHFETASSWKAAQATLTFQPREPGYTAGLRLRSIRIYVRDHKLRELSITDRTQEKHRISEALARVDAQREKLVSRHRQLVRSG